METGWFRELTIEGFMVGSSFVEYVFNCKVEKTVAANEEKEGRGNTNFLIVVTDHTIPKCPLE